MSAKLSKELPSPADVIKSVDVDALEATNWTVFGAKGLKKKGGTGANLSTTVSTTATAVSGEDRKRRVKKKRKPKLPKNFDPARQPDPERWLPRKERTTYRKVKRDRRRIEPMKGTQGGSSDQADRYDMSKQVTTSADSQPTASLGGAKPKPPPSKKKGGKKKGGRW